MYAWYDTNAVMEIKYLILGSACSFFLTYFYPLSFYLPDDHPANVFVDLLLFSNRRASVLTTTESWTLPFLASTVTLSTTNKTRMYVLGISKYLFAEKQAASFQKEVGYNQRKVSPFPIYIFVMFLHIVQYKQQNVFQGWRLVERAFSGSM